MDIPSHLLPIKVDRAEFARAHHFFLVPRGVTPEMVVEPDFWMHQAGRRFRVYDRVEVVAEDGSFEADLRVMALDPRGLWAQMRVLNLVQGIDGIAPKENGPDKDGFVVEYDAGGVHRWRILRGAELVAKGFPTEADARDALANLKAAKPRVKAA